MRMVLKALTTLFFVLLSSHAYSQELCASTPEGLTAAKRAIAEINSFARPGLVQRVQGALQYLDEKIQQLPEFPPKPPVTPFGTPVTPYMYGLNSGNAEPPKREEEKRFSWWGYRHQELHDSGAIAELEAKTGSKCCNNIKSGECRITSFVTVGVSKRKVLIDGLLCDLSGDTKEVVLESLKATDLDKVVVCAGKTSNGTVKEENRSCPSTYCRARARTTG